MDHDQTPLINYLDERGGHTRYLALSSENMNEGGDLNNPNQNDEDPLNDPDMLRKKKKRRKIKKKRICTY